MTNCAPPSDFSGRGGRCGVHDCCVVGIPAGPRAATARATAGWRGRRASSAAARDGAASRAAVRKCRRSRRRRPAVSPMTRPARVAVAVAQRLGEFGIELVGTFGDVAGLRPLAESLLGRLARPVGVGEVGAAVPRIVRRRPALQRRSLREGFRAGSRVPWPMAGLSSSANVGSSARHVRPRRLGAGRLGRVLLRMLRRIARAFSPWPTIWVESGGGGK